MMRDAAVTLILPSPARGRGARPAPCAPRRAPALSRHGPRPATSPAPNSSALANLDSRAREIFRRIVDSYLASGEPVGSRHLSRLLPISLSPASVRNVMQDLEELGLIYAPHTSAGRLPTQQGLRFYVDALLEFGGLAREERARIDSQVRAAAEEGGFEGALTQATTLLSNLTRGAGVVLTTKENARLKHIEFVRLEPEKALAVLVGEDGSVENRVVATPAGMPASTLVEVSNYLNAHVRGRTLAEAREEIEQAREAARGELDALAARLVDAGLASWAGVEEASRQLIVRGQANLLGDLRAEDDLERIRLLFADLETKTDVIDLLAPRRERRGRQDLHRLGEQAVLAVRLLDDRRAFARRRSAHRRRSRRDRPDAAELRPHRADGRIRRAGARRPQTRALKLGIGAARRIALEARGRKGEDAMPNRVEQQPRPAQPGRSDRASARQMGRDRRLRRAADPARRGGVGLHLRLHRRHGDAERHRSSSSPARPRSASARTRKGWRRFFLWVIGGVLYLAVGVVCIVNPIFASLALTLALGAGLIAAGGRARLSRASAPRRASRAAWSSSPRRSRFCSGLIIVMRWPFGQRLRPGNPARRRPFVPWRGLGDIWYGAARAALRRGRSGRRRRVPRAAVTSGARRRSCKGDWRTRIFSRGLIVVMYGSATADRSNARFPPAVQVVSLPRAGHGRGMGRSTPDALES